MSTLLPYRVNSYRRICDICGRPRQIEHIRFADGIAICDIHPKFRTALQLNKINARVRVPKILPVPKPKAFVPSDTYQAAESQIFNWVNDGNAADGVFESRDVTSNAGGFTTTRTNQGRAAAVIYLADLVRENKRPAAWVARAKNRIARNLGQLAGVQFASGFSSSILYGSFNTTPILCEDSAMGGLAFLAGYEILGTPSYLLNAKLCASALRHFQAGHLLAVKPSSTDAAGTAAAYRGAWSNNMLNASERFDHRYYPSSLVCLQFLTALLAVVGDGMYGITNTGGGVFTSAPSYLLSQSIADGRAFWANGIADIVTGTTYTGLSASTPREFFNSYPASKQAGGVTGTQSWEYQDAGSATGTLITGANWARAIAALYAVDGLSAQVTALHDYLTSFKSNTAFELPAKAGAAVIQNGQAGKYDPTIAPATLLKVRAGSPLAATAVNGSSFYDWSAAGMLAPIQSTRDRVSFQTAKETLSLPYQRYSDKTPHDGETLYLGPLGISGLSFQPWTAVGARIQSATRAAQVGNFYRYAPQAFTGKGH